ncbi:MAG: hypothetical protein WAX07_02040 [Candidatus Altiarchaeia archaeon]
MGSRAADGIHMGMSYEAATGRWKNPACLANASCDSGSCNCCGKCGTCTCFQGTANPGREIICGGRNTYPGKRDD